MSPITLQEAVVFLMMIILVAAGYYICQILFCDEKANQEKLEKKCDSRRRGEDSVAGK